MDIDSRVYMEKMIHKLAVVFLIVGALNWGLIGFSRVNFVERVFGRGTRFVSIIYVLVGLSALFLAFNRDTYLPFLGESVFPCSILQDQIPAGATRTVKVQVQPGAKVVYWASEPADGGAEMIPNYADAYRMYHNAGVTTADDKGVATLTVREPQAYTVPIKGRLEPHVHFRICGPTGFIGRIKTVFLADGRIEGFTGH